MLALKDKQIYFATKPVDFRLSIDGLSRMVQNNIGTHIHDGSIYVFYNRHANKIKCLFWDNNGFVLYYKRLEGTRFKFKQMTKDIQSISQKELETILSGFEPKDEIERKQIALVKSE